MRCEEAQPLVSALYDRQLVSPDIAEHISGCPGCRGRLRDYAQLGAELRLLASHSVAEEAEPVPVALPAAQRSRRTRRWSAPVLLPRYVAVSMAVAILALSLGLGFVEAERRVEVTSQEFQQALYRGDATKVAQMLAKNPALANSQKDQGLLPLYVVAAWHLNESADRQIAGFLLAAGADVNARIPGSLETPLHAAAALGKEAVVALLLAHGANANVRNWRGMTPMDRAIQMGRQDVIELLRAKGANVDLFNAADLGETKFVSEWLARDPSLVNARDSQGRTLLEVAATRRNRELVLLLLSYHPQLNIFLAAAAGELALVENFLERDPRLANAENERGMTPLYFAAAGCHRDVAELLLQRGADVNHGERSVIEGPLPEGMSRIVWYTPLHVAAASGDREMALVLLKYGANPRAHSRMGTPYHRALMSGHKELAEELLRPR